MSKGLDLLISSKTDDVLNTSKVTSKTAKKGDSSLFDKLLSSAKKDLNSSNKENLLNTKQEDKKVLETSSGKNESLNTVLKSETSKSNILTNLLKNSQIETEIDIKENDTQKEKRSKNILEPKTAELESKPLEKKTKVSNSLMDKLLQSSKKTFEEQKKFTNLDKNNKGIEDETLSKDGNKVIDNKLLVKANNLEDKSESLKVIKNEEKVENEKSVLEEEKLSKMSSLIDKLQKDSEPSIGENKLSNIKNKSDELSKNTKDNILDNSSSKVVEKQVIIDKEESQLSNKIIQQNSTQEEKKTKINSENSKLNEEKIELNVNKEKKLFNKEGEKLELKVEKDSNSTTNTNNEKVSLIDKLVNENSLEIKKKDKREIDNTKKDKTETDNTKNDIVKPASNLINEELVSSSLNKLDNHISTKIAENKSVDKTLNVNTQTNEIVQSLNISKEKNKVAEISENNSLKKTDNSAKNIKEEQSQTITSEDNSKTKINEKVANELAQINRSKKEETLDVSISKDSPKIERRDNSKEDISDKVLKNENNDTKLSNIKEEIKSEPTKKISLEEMMKNSRDNSSTVSQSKNEMVTNIYLSTQKKMLSDTSMEVKNEVINSIKDAKSTKDIEKGAKLLNLGLEKQEVKLEKALDQQIIQKTPISSTFDKLSLLGNNIKDNIESKNLSKISLNSLSSSDLTDDTVEEKVVELNVNSTITQTIQNRIVAARQQMASMMSDLARTMYENYKPPVTAFRVNLNPSSLGSIAIVLKNEQKGSLSISMSVSNSSTKDALVDNQSSLRENLSRTFLGSTDFNLEFDASEESYSDANQENKKNQNFEDEFLNSSVASKNQDEKEEIKDSSNYM